MLDENWNKKSRNVRCSEVWEFGRNFIWFFNSLVGSYMWGGNISEANGAIGSWFGVIFFNDFLFVFTKNWMLSRRHHKLCKAAIPATQFLYHAQNNRFGSPAVARKRIMIIRYYFWLFDSNRGQKQRLKFLGPFSHPHPDSNHEKDMKEIT